MFGKVRPKVRCFFPAPDSNKIFLGDRSNWSQPPGKKNSAQKTKEKKNKTEKFDLAIMTWVERGRERGREIETVKERVSD